jgi:glutamate/tyrosine decarboxylase-like PLP-dependent enzyme
MYLMNFSKCGGSGMESSVIFMKDKKEYMELVSENMGGGDRELSAEDSRYLNNLRIGEATKTGLWKLHFMLQNTGMDGFKAHVSKSVDLAKYIEGLIGKDPRFELVPKRVLALTLFRLVQKVGESGEAHEQRNFDLVGKLCEDGRLFVVAGKVSGVYFIRISVQSSGEESDYDFFYKRLVEVCEENNYF